MASQYALDTRWWCLAYKLGYLIQCEPYQGAKTGNSILELGVGGSAVCDLISKLQGDKKYNIYLDNFLTSLRLIAHLSNMGFGCTGDNQAQPHWACSTSIGESHEEGDSRIQLFAHRFKFKPVVMLMAWQQPRMCCIQLPHCRATACGKTLVCEGEKVNSSSPTECLAACVCTCTTHTWEVSISWFRTLPFTESPSESEGGGGQSSRGYLGRLSIMHGSWTDFMVTVQRMISCPLFDQLCWIFCLMQRTLGISSSFWIRRTCQCAWISENRFNSSFWPESRNKESAGCVTKVQKLCVKFDVLLHIDCFPLFHIFHMSK